MFFTEFAIADNIVGNLVFAMCYQAPLEETPVRC